MSQQVSSCDHLLVLDEGILVDGLDDIFEEDLGGESVAMVDDGLTVLTVPTVHCGARKKTRRDCKSRTVFKKWTTASAQL